MNMKCLLKELLGVLYLVNKVLIKVLDDSYKFINYLIYNKISYKNLKKLDRYYLLEVGYEDFKRIRRRYETKIIKYYGKVGIKIFLKKNRYIIICLIYSMFLLRLLSLTIFDIRVNTSSIEIKNIILSSLKENGIDIYKKKKSFKEIEFVKEKILSNNKDKIEWLEIREKGCVYIVDVTPRIEKSVIKDNNSSSIVAKRDGVIKHINVINGTKIKELGEYVKKGEVIISGNIIKDEKLVNTVRADGEVYAETWYFVNTSVPFKYKKYIDTGKVVNHYYLDIFGKKISLLGKYESKNTKSSDKVIIKKPFLLFSLHKEKKKVFKSEMVSISEKEAYKLALEESELKIKSRLKDKEYVISKNVLKKEVNSSKIKVEVFFIVYENIGVTSKLEKIGKKEE